MLLLHEYFNAKSDAGQGLTKSPSSASATNETQAVNLV
jgi:hypothetical protein